MNSCIRDYSTSFIPSKFFHVPEELNICFSFFDVFYFIFLPLILFQCFVCYLYSFHTNRPLEYLAQMFLIATAQVNFLLLLFWAFTCILKILIITIIPTKSLACKCQVQFEKRWNETHIPQRSMSLTAGLQVPILYSRTPGLTHPGP